MWRLKNTFVTNTPTYSAVKLLTQKKNVLYVVLKNAAKDGTETLETRLVKIGFNSFAYSGVQSFKLFLLCPLVK